jgi:hypothetical protein
MINAHTRKSLACIVTSRPPSRPKIYSGTAGFQLERMSGKNNSVSAIDLTHDRAATAADALRIKDFEAPTSQRWLDRIWARKVRRRPVIPPSASPGPIPAGPATMELVDVVPVSWPNSAFRNVSRRGTKAR